MDRIEKMKMIDGLKGEVLKLEDMINDESMKAQSDYLAMIIYTWTSLGEYQKVIETCDVWLKKAYIWCTVKHIQFKKTTPRLLDVDHTVVLLDYLIKEQYDRHVYTIAKCLLVSWLFVEPKRFIDAKDMLTPFDLNTMNLLCTVYAMRYGTLKESLIKCKALDLPVKWMLMGYIYFYKAEYDLSLESFLESIKHERYQADSLNMIGIIESTVNVYLKLTTNVRKITTKH